MRLQIAAGNWKMNKTYAEGLELAAAIQEGSSATEGALVILGAPFIHLKTLCDSLGESPHIKVAAQNCHHQPSGAYTGEVSVGMLSSVGVEYVILGH
jgi:triosephosphate isomerase